MSKLRLSTRDNYLCIWKLFNQFVIRLDNILCTWEQRAAMFCAHLIDEGLQSATVRSYLSAIKSVLKDNDYDWDDSQTLLATLIRACRQINDQVKVRFPIKKSLLEVLLFELPRVLGFNQPYLIVLYRALFALAYYGLFRVGELASGTHPAQARDVHITTNKHKILIILRTSKTHAKESRPQQIKITSQSSCTSSKPSKSHFCPFQLATDYMKLRGGYSTLCELFFIFHDCSPVCTAMVRTILRKTLNSLNLNASLYDTHSFHVNRHAEARLHGGADTIGRKMEIKCCVSIFKRLISCAYRCGQSI